MQKQKKEHSRIRTIRLKNLQQELSNRKLKGQKNLHTALEVSSSRLSQLSRGHAPITDGVARKFENALGLESHALDAQFVKAYVFLAFSKFKYEPEDYDKSDLANVLKDINTNWGENNKPILRLNYILGEWDAVIEIKCQYLEQVKEVVGDIHSDHRATVAKSTTYIAFGDTVIFD